MRFRLDLNPFPIFRHLKVPFYPKSFERSKCQLNIVSQNLIKNYIATIPKKALSNAKFNTKEYLIKLLSSNLMITNGDAKNIVNSNKAISENGIDNIVELLSLYSKFGISPNVIKDNLFLLELESKSTRKKLETLSKIDLKDMNHAVPFLGIPFKKIMYICYRTLFEAMSIPHGNRLYYLCDQLKVDPVVMGHYISKRLFIYEIKFDHLKSSLAILLDMGMDSENICKDLWVLRYKPEIIQERLSKISSISEKKLMPWMVKCPEKVFERTIKLATETKKLLGENQSVMNYLAQRLNCSNEIVQGMAANTPAILTVRVTKVKNTLDFLFSEGYTEKDVISMPRVLAHSVETMQHRLKELRSIGVNPKTLSVFYKSNRDFRKYIVMHSKQDTKEEKKK